MKLIRSNQIAVELNDATAWRGLYAYYVTWNWDFWLNLKLERTPALEAAASKFLGRIWIVTHYGYKPQIVF